MGFTLDELKNDITGTTDAFGAAIDHGDEDPEVDVFEKFREADETLTTQMKSVARDGDRAILRGESRRPSDAGRQAVRAGAGPNDKWLEARSGAGGARRRRRCPWEAAREPRDVGRGDPEIRNC